MTDGDYIAIAFILRESTRKAGQNGWESDHARRGFIAAGTNIAMDLADRFAADNPRFNRARFLAACGVQS